MKKNIRKILERMERESWARVTRDEVVNGVREFLKKGGKVKRLKDEVDASHQVIGEDDCGFETPGTFIQGTRGVNYKKNK